MIKTESIKRICNFVFPFKYIIWRKKAQDYGQF